MSDNNPDMDLITNKAQAIVNLGSGMHVNEFFGAMAMAAAQAIKCLRPDQIEETLEWYIRNVSKIALAPDSDKDLH